MESAEPAMVLEKIRRYCAYQERCVRDVEGKLKDWTVRKKLIPSIISELKKEKYIDEIRYAKAYARGKLRMNKWGRQKIEFELRMKGLPDSVVSLGIKEIDEDEYLKVLKEIITLKKKEFNPEKDLNIREKIINFALGKGYEMELILDFVKSLKI